MGSSLWLLVLLLLTCIFGAVTWGCRQERYKTPNNANSWALAKNKVVTSRILLDPTVAERLERDVAKVEASRKK